LLAVTRDDRAVIVFVAVAFVGLAAALPAGALAAAAVPVRPLFSGVLLACAAPDFGAAFFATLGTPDFAAPNFGAAFFAVTLGTLAFFEVTLVCTAFFCGIALLAEAAFFTAMLNPFEMALDRPRENRT